MALQFLKLISFLSFVVVHILQSLAFSFESKWPPLFRSGSITNIQRYDFSIDHSDVDFLLVDELLEVVMTQNTICNADNMVAKLSVLQYLQIAIPALYLYPLISTCGLLPFVNTRTLLFIDRIEQDYNFLFLDGKKTYFALDLVGIC